jgi:hypothetical protein
VSSNIFSRLARMLPDAPVLVGRVLEHHDDDTSTVELPVETPSTVIGGGVARGSLIRPRGTTVPVGEWAFVRRNVIETRAPDALPLPIEVGSAEPSPEGSVWDEGAPLTVNAGATYSLSESGRQLNVDSGGGSQRVETVTTPLRSAGRRYCEFTYTGPVDQFGFATGDIAVAGGTLDFLDEPIGTLVNVLRNNNFGTWFIWLRKWTAGPTFEEFFIPIDAVAEGDRIGFDIDLDGGTTAAVYVNGAEIAPGPLTGDDLTNWNALSTWAAGQSAAPQTQQRLRSTAITLRVYTLASEISYLPSGADAWDAS